MPVSAHLSPIIAIFDLIPKSIPRSCIHYWRACLLWPRVSTHDFPVLIELTTVIGFFVGIMRESMYIINLHALFFNGVIIMLLACAHEFPAWGTASDARTSAGVVLALMVIFASGPKLAGRCWSRRALQAILRHRRSLRRPCSLHRRRSRRPTDAARARFPPLFLVPLCGEPLLRTAVMIGYCS